MPSVHTHGPAGNQIRQALDRLAGGNGSGARASRWRGVRITPAEVYELVEMTRTSVPTLMRIMAREQASGLVKLKKHGVYSYSPLVPFVDAHRLPSVTEISRLTGVKPAKVYRAFRQAGRLPATRTRELIVSEQEQQAQEPAARRPSNDEREAQTRKLLEPYLKPGAPRLSVAEIAATTGLHPTTIYRYKNDVTRRAREHPKHVPYRVSWHKIKGVIDKAEGERLTMNEIARRAGVPYSTTHALLKERLGGLPMPAEPEMETTEPQQAAGPGETVRDMPAEAEEYAGEPAKAAPAEEMPEPQQLRPLAYQTGNGEYVIGDTKGRIWAATLRRL
jgi:AraC-like DNA-binding protein